MQEPPIKAAILPVTPFQQNCAFLWDEASKEAMVIDPGGDVPRLLAGIDQLGVRVVKIENRETYEEGRVGEVISRREKHLIKGSNARAWAPAESRRTR